MRDARIGGGIAALHALVPLLGDFNFIDGAYARRAHVQHPKIVQAISRRDAARAEAAAREHVKESLAHRLHRIAGSTAPA